MDNLQRTIVCDIRYVLFVIDKYANAGHLIDEMKIVKGQPKPVITTNKREDQKAETIKDVDNKPDVKKVIK